MSGWAALGAVADSAFGSAIGAYRDRENYKNSKKLMDYQNQLDIANWNMVNEYNKPSAQMARYAEAGLNPNLIYGQSNTAGSISAPSGKFDSSIPDINPVASYLTYKQMNADVRNKEKQNSLLQSQADYVKEQVKGQALENALKEKTLRSVGQGNPNDPYWYRDLKKHPGLNSAANLLGRFVGLIQNASPNWTVTHNGREYEAYSGEMAIDLLDRLRKNEERERRNRNIFAPRGEGGR